MTAFMLYEPVMWTVLDDVILHEDYRDTIKLLIYWYKMDESL
ncbi:hypothetical protein J2W91_001604 [Paenibacillus amylolyticus]|uniref:Uncharacterized protein n=1 Tax=Paenibacillus amylolyticus TaxID=1451 RepID=A0AAP5GZR7_PAEAM|nr:hypothetical protein [Paenibacillus amylolyticus]